jgi:hypothetical protein
MCAMSPHSGNGSGWKNKICRSNSNDAEKDTIQFSLYSVIVTLRFINTVFHNKPHFSEHESL